MTQEEIRLSESGARRKHWKRWGPYLSERAWGTVREDYSPYGNAWEYLSHDQARSRAYRWNEDGLAGISDRKQMICFALALWNERDPILKERIFGLTGNEGNHGEDVKEYYFYLDSTPTHSYMKYLYKYPQAEFPYGQLVEENRRRGKNQPEFELLDTGVFNDNRYFDVFVEYAKADTEDILIKITVANRGPEAASLRLLPTVWFRNTWSWGNSTRRPELHEARPAPNPVIELNHDQPGNRWLHCEGSPELLFTENETNARRLFGVENPTPYVKDGINDYIVHGSKDAVNPEHTGTKAAAHYQLTIGAGETAVVRLRLTNSDFKGKDAFASFDKTFALRQQRGRRVLRHGHSARPLSRCAERHAPGLCRHVVVQAVLSLRHQRLAQRRSRQSSPARGAPQGPQPRVDSPVQRGRHFHARQVGVSVVCGLGPGIPLHSAGAGRFRLRERTAHADAARVVHASQRTDSRLRVGVRRCESSGARLGGVARLQDRQEAQGQGRSRIPAARLPQADAELHLVGEPQGRRRHEHLPGRLSRPRQHRRVRPQRSAADRRLHRTIGWHQLDGDVHPESAGYRSGTRDRRTCYEDVASKFWEHFIYIANAMSHRGDEHMGLWNEEDGFFYDVLKLPDGNQFPMKIRSMVGLIPLFAVETLEPDVLDKLPDFKKRLEWFIDNRPDLTANLACMRTEGMGDRRLLSIADADQLRSILKFMLDEREFLSPYGIRALSQFHRDNPYRLTAQGMEHRVDYEPGESSTGLFGGNSNWRGPIWFPVNYLLVESLQKFHHYFGDDFKVEFPTGSGKMMTLWEVAGELSRRMTNIFLQDQNGRRPVFGNLEKFQTDPHWRDLVLFHEYFHGDSGAGVGASHQTGWTGVVTKLMQQSGESRERSRQRKKTEPALASVAAD